MHNCLTVTMLATYLTILCAIFNCIYATYLITICCSNPPQDYILLIRCLHVCAFCLYAFCLTALWYSPLNARMHTVWPNRMHATCLRLTQPPLISCTGTCTPKLTPSGAQNAIDATPLLLTTITDDIRIHPTTSGRYSIRL